MPQFNGIQMVQLWQQVKLQPANCLVVSSHSIFPKSNLCSEAQPTSFCSLRNGPRRESVNGSSSFSSLSRAEHWFKTVGAHKNWNQNGSIFSANQQICILYIYMYNISLIGQDSCGCVQFDFVQKQRVFFSF